MQQLAIAAVTGPNVAQLGFGPLPKGPCSAGCCRVLAGPWMEDEALWVRAGLEERQRVQAAQAAQAGRTQQLCCKGFCRCPDKAELQGGRCGGFANAQRLLLPGVGQSVKGLVGSG